MRICTSIFFLLLCHLAHGQALRVTSGSSSSKKTASVTGAIYLPSVLTLKLSSVANTQFNFDNWEAYKNGIVKPAVVHAKIKSTRPWVLTVSAPEENFVSTTGNSLPYSLLKVKPTNAATFVALSRQPNTLLTSSSSQISSEQDFDLKMDSPLGFKGGNYSATIVFSLTAQ
jgi:hypothetical protein